MKGLRLIATDLDGTLLEPGGEVTPRTQAALAAARSAGLHVLLVTGRPPRWVHWVVDRLELGTPVICANGAILYDAAKGRLLAHDPIAPETARRIVAGLRQVAPGVCFALEIGLDFGHEPDFAPLNRRPLPRSMLVGDALDLINGPITKVLARHEALDAAELKRRLEAIGDLQVEATYSTDLLLEIGSHGVNKAKGLARYCRGLGVVAEQVAAFGDMPNDLPMLEWAGLGVAVANAHRDVLAGADLVAASNAEDGVASMIETWLASAARSQPIA